MKKSILTLALASLFLTACGGGGGSNSDSISDNKDNSSTKPETTDPVKKNQKPIAISYEEVTVTTGTVIELDASQSHDPDNDIITYKWEVIGFPKDAEYRLSQDDIVKPSFTASTPGSYRIALTVNDGKEDSDRIFINVTAGDAKANNKPSAQANEWYERIVRVNDLVTLQGIPSDPDGDKLTTAWTIKEKPSNSRLVIDKPYFNTIQFNPDVAGQYVFTYTATDPFGLKDSFDITIDAGIGNLPPQAVIIEEPYITTNYQTVYINGFRSKDYEKQPLSYKWSLVSKPAGSQPKTESLDVFIANNGSFALTPDKEGIYVVQLVVSDGVNESRPTQTTVEVKNLGLILKDSEGKELSWPYNSTNNSAVVHYECAIGDCDQWANKFATFSLIPTDRNYTITDVKCETKSDIKTFDPNFHDVCFMNFKGDNLVKDGHVLHRGSIGSDFTMHALADRNKEIEYTFSFRIVETDQKFQYTTKLKTTYQP